MSNENLLQGIFVDGGAGEGPSMSHEQMIAELDLARKTLSKTRSQLTSATYTKATTQSFLDNESLLLERIESTRKF